METFWLVVFVLMILAVAVIAEFRLSKIEREARSRDAHPAGSVCPDCHTRIADWDVHRRLFHQARVAAPEDVW